MRELRETRAPGPVPHYLVPGWKERYGILAGITGQGEDGFDLGLWSRQPVGDVMRRWQAFRREFPGFPGWVLAHQVHGREVAWHPARPTGWTLMEGVDGHATRTPGLMLLVTVADCIPVYLAAPRHGVVALLHAGWRGTAAGILERGLSTLFQHAGISAADIVMHCGVGICGACYEVGSEVMDGLGLARQGSGPFHVDLRAVLAGQAARLGIPEVSISPWCSAHDRPAFFSHRASHGADGRMVAYLGFPDSPQA